MSQIQGGPVGVTSSPWSHRPGLDLSQVLAGHKVLHRFSVSSFVRLPHLLNGSNTDLRHNTGSDELKRFMWMFLVQISRLNQLHCMLTLKKHLRGVSEFPAYKTHYRQGSPSWGAPWVTWSYTQTTCQVVPVGRCCELSTLTMISQLSIQWHFCQNMFDIMKVFLTFELNSVHWFRLI